MKTYAVLYEVPLLYALLYAFNQLFYPGLPGFIDITPHPFWGVILLFALRYGTNAGFYSGVCGAALFFACTWFEGERFLFDDTFFFFEPFLFIIIGTLCGYAVQCYKNQITFLTQETTGLRDREQKLIEEHKFQQSIISELEKRIVTRINTLIHLYEGARKLESSLSREVYKAALGFTVKILEAQAGAIYLLEQGKLIVKETVGWETDNHWPREILPGEGLAGKAFASGKLTTIRDVLGTEKAEAEADCLIAGVLKRGEAGEPIGVLCIQRLPFLQFNNANINVFSFLTQWANRSIGRSAYIENLKTNEIIDPELGLFSHRYLELRAEEEFSKSKTYYLPMSLALIGLTHANGLPFELTHTALIAISQLLRETCGPIHVVARFPTPHIPFAILMTTTSEKQALELKKQLILGMQNLAIGLQLQVGTASFEPRHKNVGELFLEAKAALND
jgi:GGDEF domain-containing protein